MASVVSSPCVRRAVWMASSNRFMATWRNTVANDGLDLPHEHGQHDLRVLLPREQVVEHERLAEDGGGLRRGERRVLQQHAPVPGQVLVHAVAQLVGQGHHVLRPCPGSSGGCRGGRTGPWSC